MMNQPFTIKVLKDSETAAKVGAFLTSADAFEQEWIPNEKIFVFQAPLDSIDKANHRYWYVEKEGVIIGAIGVRENKYGTAGYEMNSDYFAVHKDYRRQGMALQLLKTVEQYVSEKGGRYLHILSCDAPYYKPARAFYEKNGYTQVGHIPDYYIENEGRVDYFKKI